jgi:UDP-N-acetylglucosamine 2-epimerase (non-hydrolysing)
MTKKIKVMVVFGTRPEAIKLAPLIRELKSRSEIETIVCVTAQHREMLDQVLNAFNIIPDYDLDIMEKEQTLETITIKIMKKLGNVIREVNPNIVLVHGDTTTAFVSALTAFYNKVSVGHIEAGLRTFNKYLPYPEEINRTLISKIADINFCPTIANGSNLCYENIKEEKIVITGNTIIDTLKITLKEDFKHEIIDWLGNHKLVLLTAHRRENIGQPMENIFKAVKRLVDNNEDIKVVYPIHLNPKIKEIADSIFDNHERIKLVPPLDVFDFHNIINKSYIIMTDSGGIQEEATFLGKPIILLRRETERPEALETGNLILVGTNEETIYETTRDLLNNKEMYKQMSKPSIIFGSGNASEIIVDTIIKELRE